MLITKSPAPLLSLSVLIVVAPPEVIPFARVIPSAAFSVSGPPVVIPAVLSTVPTVMSSMSVKEMAPVPVTAARLSTSFIPVSVIVPAPPVWSLRSAMVIVPPVWFIALPVEVLRVSPVTPAGLMAPAEIVIEPASTVSPMRRMFAVTVPSSAADNSSVLPAASVADPKSMESPAIGELRVTIPPAPASTVPPANSIFGARRLIAVDPEIIASLFKVDPAVVRVILNVPFPADESSVT